MWQDSFLMEERLSEYEVRALIAKFNHLASECTRMPATTVSLLIISLYRNPSSRLPVSEFTDLFSAARDLSIKHGAVTWITVDGISCSNLAHPVVSNSVCTRTYETLERMVLVTVLVLH
jgi:hypothetical protein